MKEAATEVIRIRPTGYKRIAKILKSNKNARTPADVVDLALDALEGEKR